MVPLYKTKIFRRQFFALLGLSLLFFAAMGGAIILRTRRAVEARELEHSAAYRDQVGKHLLSWLGERKDDVALLARTMELEAGPEGPAAARLGAFLASKPDFVDAFLVDAQGRVALTRVGPSAQRTYLGDRDYARSALSGKPFVSGYFEARLRKTPIFAIAEPLWRDGRVAGAAVGVISISRLLGVVDAASLEHLGSAFLVDSRRALVSNPEFAKGLAEAESAAGAGTATAAGAAAGSGQAAALVIDSLAAREVAAGRSGSASYGDAAGKKVIGSFGWIEGLRLGLVVELSYERALGPVTGLLRFAAFLALAMLLLLATLSYALSAGLVGPIAALLEAAGAVAEGRFDAPMPASAGNELDQLGELFGRMAGAVRDREERLKESAARDSLTGLYNHGRIIEYLELELRRKRRSGEPVTLAMLDIDHFKAVNDSHGHVAGDAVLRGLAGILQSSAREGDLVGRYGGEEFAVILDSGSPELAAAFCERIRSKVEAAAFGHEGLDLRVTASLGWASSPAGCLQAAGLVALADAALYRAKAEGRNRVRGAVGAAGAAGGGAAAPGSAAEAGCAEEESLQKPPKG